MTSNNYQTLDKHWQAAAKVVFGTELGPIAEYVEWLTSLNMPLTHRKSSVSGKPTSYLVQDYAADSKWIDFSEVNLQKKYEPLPLEEAKDFDSLRHMLKERVVYAGGLVLGQSHEVERSSSLSNSSFMYETGELGNCQYLAYCTLGRYDRDSFGCNGIGESEFCIRCYETNNDKRCFEVWMSQFSSDCYYSYGLNNCSECLFCFNLRNKHHCIGNVELPPEKYIALKKKLLNEMAERLKKEKKLPSLAELAAHTPLDAAMLQKIADKAEKGEGPVSFSAAGDAAPKTIEEGFSKVSEVVFGKKLAGRMDDYAPWLRAHVRRLERCKSAASGHTVWLGDYASCFELPRNRLVSFEEGKRLGEMAKMEMADVEKLNLQTAPALLKSIAYFASEYAVGSTPGMVDCPTAQDSSNCYRSFPVMYSKMSAHCYWPHSTQYAFGCTSIMDSEFCVRCYESVKLSRCFEVDSGRDCSDCYFCHDVENVRNGILCFNVKNLQYAVGNVEVGREKFLEIKKRMLGELLPKLEKGKKLDVDIYNVGCVNKARK